MKNAELKKRFRNKYVIRVAAGAVTIAVLGSSIGAYAVHAQRNGNAETEAAEEAKDTEETAEQEEMEEAKDTLLEALSDREEAGEDAGKEETVYVVAKADGTTDEVIVSEWLKNRSGSDTLEDMSDLKDIVNVKGDETFERNGDEITWDAGGNDIYYQGTTDKELPVTEKITYYLEGEEMSPEEIAGKSGKVTIRFDYTNHEKTTQIVDGEEHEVYVPFTVITGMILPEDYSNVEVANGKVISDGSKKMVVGVAMPGLKDSLAIGEEEQTEGVEIPDYIEVTAEVENFSLDMTMTVMMNDLLGEGDLEEAFDLSGLEESIDTLSDSSEQLADGSSDLAEGLGTLKSSIKEFASGINTLKSGVASYTSGVSQLDSGIGTLKDGASALADGAGTLVSGVTAISDSFSGQNGLVNGAAAVRDGVNALDRSLRTPMTDQEKEAVAAHADAAVESSFTGGMSEAIADQAAQQFQQTMEGSKEAVEQQISSQLSQSELYSTMAEAVYDQQVLQLYQQYQAAVDGIIQQAQAAGADVSITDAVEQLYQQSSGGQTLRSAVEAGVSRQLSEAAGQIAEGVTTGIAETGKEAMGESVADACETAAKTAAESAAVSGAEAAKSLIADQIEQGGLVSGTQSLSEGVNKLYQEGIQPLKSGVDSLAGSIPALTGGVSQLAQGSSALVSNNEALTDGANALSGAAAQLSDGADQLAAGSEELMEGMAKFNEEGIQKLADAYHGEVKTLFNKLTAVVNAGRDYQTYTKVPEGTKGTVRFILRTEAVKADEE